MGGSIGSEAEMNLQLVNDLAEAKGEIVQLRQRLAELEDADELDARREMVRLRGVVTDLRALITDVEEAAEEPPRDGIAAAYELGRIQSLCLHVPELQDLLGEGAPETEDVA